MTKYNKIQTRNIKNIIQNKQNLKNFMLKTNIKTE